MTVTTIEPRAARWPRATRIGLPAVLLGLFGYGVWAWGYQIANGLEVTGMRNVQLWGLYIAFFMFFVGLSAGGLIVASAGTIFGVTRLRPLMRLAIWTSFVNVVLAGLFLLPDIGRPDRVWHLFRWPHWSSPMVWDVIIVFLYGIMSIVYLWLHTRDTWAERGSRLALGYTDLSPRARARDHRIIGVFAYFALPAAIALHSITAWIIGLQKAHADWFSTVMAPLFVASALMSGLALLLLIILVLRRQGRVEVDDGTIHWLGGLLAAFIAVDLFLQLAQLLTYRWAGQSDQLEASRLLLTGRYAWTLWVTVALALVALGMLLAPRVRRSIAGVAAASVLAVVAVFFVRISLVLAGFADPIVDAQPGVSVGPVEGATSSGIPDATSFVTSGTYSPTWVEYSITVGWLAFWGLLILLGARYLPLRESAEGPEPEPAKASAIEHTAPQAG